MGAGYAYGIGDGAKVISGRGDPATVSADYKTVTLKSDFPPKKAFFMSLSPSTEGETAAVYIDTEANIALVTRGLYAKVENCAYKISGNTIIITLPTAFMGLWAINLAWTITG